MSNLQHLGEKFGHEGRVTYSEILHPCEHFILDVYHRRIGASIWELRIPTQTCVDLQTCQHGMFSISDLM